MEKQLLKDDAAQDGIRSYFDFHMRLIGKQFITPEGKIMTKLDVWCANYKELDHLRYIASGRDREHRIIDKPGWVNGTMKRG